LKVSDRSLMLFHDGELDDEGARRVRVGRLCHAEVTAKLEGLTLLGTAVRCWAVENGVNARAERLEHENTRRRRRAFATGLTVCGMALGALLVAPGLERTVQGSATAAPATSASVEAGADAVAVEAVDFGARPGTIFVVEGEAQRETTVVWLDDANSRDPAL
jgi:hypothetical protein